MDMVSFQLAALQCALKSVFFSDLVVSTKHLPSDVIAASSNPPFGPSPRTL